MQTSSHIDPIVQVVVFEINSKEYAIPVFSTKEIIRIPAIIDIPNSPGFLAGVINLRGNIICIIDMRKQFNAPANDTESTRIIIVQINKMNIGLIVDSVHEVIKIKKSQIDPVPPMITFQIPNNCLVGIAKVEARIIALLNLQNILSQEQLALLKQ
ncbi:MAG: hypothetical protein ACD_79C00504G0003 [uncultured bacterium]|nr:MAG: hypothetical protein ACD_79C00504G0003 [uncultured bacterium]